MKDELSQADKLKHLHNDLLVQRRTYLDIAQASALELGGRFAGARPQVTAVPVVPRLPASSPWASDPVPPEPPLGFSVDDLPVVGEPHEVERAARILEVEVPDVDRKIPDRRSKGDAGPSVVASTLVPPVVDASHGTVVEPSSSLDAAPTVSSRFRRRF
jgi:hypothetical protein